MNMTEDTATEPMVASDAKLLHSSTKKKMKNKKNNLSLIEDMKSVSTGAVGVDISVVGDTVNHKDSLSTPKKKKKKRNLDDSIKETNNVSSINTSDNDNTNIDIKSKRVGSKNKVDNPTHSVGSDVQQTIVSNVSKVKKQKKKKSRETSGSSIEKCLNVNQDDDDDADHPESIDSGCVPDSVVEPTETIVVNWSQVRSSLLSEHTYVSGLMKHVPSIAKFNPNDYLAKSVKRKRDKGSEAICDDDDDDQSSKQKRPKKTVRVDDYAELKRKWTEKLDALKQGRTKKSGKSPIEKRQEKNIRKKLLKLEQKKKQKMKKKEKLAQKKMVKSEPDGKKASRPIYNEDGQLVFSKFDFSSAKAAGHRPDAPKNTDLKQILSQVLKNKAQVKSLEEKGRLEDASQIKEKKAWKGALLRAEGEKVRDDPELLKRSLKKIESKKKYSKKKWDSRTDNVQKNKKDKLNKRTDNVMKRKQEKVNTKMKKMSKRGHIVPGF